eukprot:143082-Pyramimonas_sp.AAC.1
MAFPSRHRHVASMSSSLPTGCCPQAMHGMPSGPGSLVLACLRILPNECLAGGGRSASSA